MKILRNSHLRRSFTLVELLVVIGIITLLGGILVPSVCRVKKVVINVRETSKQRENYTALSTFSMDNHDRLPKSVAVRCEDDRLAWREPTLLAGFRGCEHLRPRSVSAHLGYYIKDASRMYCSNAPSVYPCLQEAWDAGDDWNHSDPNTDPYEDPLFGTYCLYWNYNAYIEEQGRAFRGPRRISNPGGNTDLLMTDYFGFGHWRNRLFFGTWNAYGSCDPIGEGDITPGTLVSSDFWSAPDRDRQLRPEDLDLTLRAVYTDGHVENFTSENILTLRVSKEWDGSRPYPSIIEPGGKFFIPADAVK